MRIGHKLSRLSFLKQLVITFAVGIFSLALTSSFAIALLSSEIIQEKLVDQGLSATETFAAQSTLALLYSSSENAEEPAKAILTFPSVQGISIFDANHSALFSKGQNALPESDELQWPDEPLLEQETDQSWYFVAPVYAGSDSKAEPSPFSDNPHDAVLLGYVRLLMSKEILHAIQRGILIVNIIVAVAFACVFLLILLSITKHLTTPLKQLADAMGLASEGGVRVRANLGGPKDIVNMEMAFNTMMEVLESRESELVSARDTALESARIKGEFAANVSHELRTPLNAVLGMLELLKEMELNARQAEYVSIALSSAESLLKLIEDILDFSRIHAGGIQAHSVDFALTDILDELIGMLASQAQHKELDLGYVIADDVPKMLRGERSRIRQVLINLVGNGLKFTKQGGVEIRISRELGHDGQLWLRFDVIDSGIGVAKDAQRRIFDAFVQADGSTTRLYGGTGLGLAICRQIIESMGGKLDVISETGMGADFWFTAPFAASPAMSVQVKSRRVDFADLRFLLLSESEGVGRFLAQLLKGWDISRIRSEKIDHMLAKLRSEDVYMTYDFAIVDQTAAGTVDLVKFMAETPGLAKVKVIFLTHQLPMGEGDLRLSNVVGYVAKPVQASHLFDCIATAINQQKSSFTRPEINRDHSICLNSSILVVEDNRANQQVVIAMLEMIGCHVEIASHGREAVAMVVGGSYDLVLMDCNMPEMDGYEATQRIRAMESEGLHLPIIAMTANVQKGDNDRCLSAGMDDYLAKPLKLSALREKLSYWLSHEKQAEKSPLLKPSVLKQPEYLLDFKVLNELKAEVGDAFPKVVCVFLEDTPLVLNKLKKFDIQNVGELAHTIKGAAMNFGAEKLVELARLLEKAGQIGDVSAVPPLVAQIESEFQLLSVALQRESQTGQRLAGIHEEKPKPCILVADDDRAIRLALSDVLQKDGYHVEQAANGLQAMAICEQKMPDLVLLDGRMPKMDGFSVCSKLRELREGSSTPVLIVTALEDEQSIERVFAVGATDYIQKPVHFSVLRQRVARLLDASRAEERASRLTYLDVLTGLPNRALFMEKLDDCLNSSLTESPMHAVFVLDLDRFKMTNDSVGHHMGDLLLKSAAERIQQCVRSTDLVSRFGSDEFTLLLDNIDSIKAASATAMDICAAIAQPFAVSGQDFYISVSIGISIYPQDGQNAGELLKHADTAMSRAKERGNSYRFYEDSMEKEVSVKRRLESDLRRALERDEFFLDYQPQYDHRTGGIIGTEALIRWQHPDLGLISPNQFIPVAEEIGLINSIGEWVLYQACHQNKAWQQAGFPAVPVAVNLSARQFDEDNFSETILEILDETHLSPCYLELEITESVMMKDSYSTGKVLASLKDKGVPISIDDFGTGFSSLSQLKYLPFTKLKIDQSFIRDVDINPDDAAIVLSIIAIAKSLRLGVIAEGVETEAQLNFLKQHDCFEVQGYYFSKPVSPEEIERLFHGTDWAERQRLEMGQSPVAALQFVG